MSKAKKITLWVLSSLLGLLFCMVGATKLQGGVEVAAQFQGWGYPPWFARVIGALELAGGIGLFVPRIARFAALGLVLIMAGAAFTHIRFSEWGNVAFNAALASALFWISKTRAAQRS